LDDLVLSIAARAGALSAVLSGAEAIDTDGMVAWEMQLETLSAELRRVTRRPVLYAVYSQLLHKFVPTELDLLQISVFDRLASAIVDALVKLQPSEAPITAVVDELTETHLEYVEKFRVAVDDGGDEGYSQSSRQEFLCYQYALLAHFTYQRLSRGLGEGFDNSVDTQLMRVSNWEDPLHARLQRRFVRFLSTNVEDKSEEILSRAFDALVDRVQVRLPAAASARYTLTSAPVSYAPWEQCLLLTKVIRNTAEYVDRLSLAPKLSRRIQEELAPELGRIAAPIELLVDKGFSRLDGKDRALVEAMLNLGHAVVGGVLSLWQVRSNMVGSLPPPDSESQERVKEFIRPLVLASGPEGVAESLPATLRDDSVETVADLLEQVPDAPPLLRSCAVLATAVRTAVSDDFRALVTYSVDKERLPESRDDCFTAALQTVLAAALILPEFNSRALFENLVAMAALEEALGTREPRRCVKQALRSAVRDASVSSAAPADVQSRLNVLAAALTMILRLPAGDGARVALVAFKDAVSSTLSQGVSPDARERCLKIAATLRIDQKIADAYMGSLLKERFDKFAGQMLLSADTALAIPELADVFIKQVEEAGRQCGLTDDEVRGRVRLLAAAIVQSVLESAVTEELRRNSDRVEALGRKAYDVQRHPIVKAAGSSILGMAVTMLSSKAGTQQLLVLVRALEMLRQRASGKGDKAGGSTWSESPSLEDPGFAEFLLELQSILVKEHSAGMVKLV
jgi:hypothetical protein